MICMHIHRCMYTASHWSRFICSYNYLSPLTSSRRRRANPNAHALNSLSAISTINRSCTDTPSDMYQHTNPRDEETITTTRKERLRPGNLIPSTLLICSAHHSGRLTLPQPVFRVNSRETHHPLSSAYIYPPD